MRTLLLLLTAATTSYVPPPRSLVLHVTAGSLSHLEAAAYCTFPVSQAEAERACAALGLEPVPSGAPGFTCRGRMDRTSLLERSHVLHVGKLLQSFDSALDTFRVSVELPSTPRTACSGLSPHPTYFPFQSTKSYGDVVEADGAVVRVTVGYAAASIGRLLAPWLFLAPLIALPLLGIRRAGRAPASLGELSRTFPWDVRLLVPLCGILALACAGLLDSARIFTLVFPVEVLDGIGARLAYLLLPPLAAVLLASLAVDGACSRRLGSPAPVRSVLAAVTVPLAVALPFLAFLFLRERAWHAFALGLLGAFVVMTAWIGGVDVRRFAVKDGPLAHAADAIAADHGMRPVEIHVAPAAASLALRAGVGHARRFVVADTLAARLSPAEADALLCLETVRRHRSWRRSVVVFLAATPVLTCFPPLLWLLGDPAVDLAARGLMAFLVGVVVSRHLTRREVREAAALLPSPEPLARALVETMAADGWSATWYPGDLRLFRIPTLARIAEELTGEPIPLPVLPPLASGEERILGPRYRQRASLRALGRTLAIAVAPPLAAALLVQPGAAASGRPWTLLAGGAAAGILATALLAPVLPAPGFRRRLARLRAALAQQGLDDPAGSFAGVSGGAYLRVHGGFHDLDFGLLHVGEDRIAFAGELHRFVLHRDEIVALREEPGADAWIPRSRLHVDWCGRAGASGTLHLRGKARLHARLLAWRDGVGPADPVPAGLDLAGPPDLPHDAGDVPPKPVAFLVSLVVVALVAAVPALLAGLPGGPTLAGSIPYVSASAAAAVGAASIPALRRSRAEARREWGLP